MAADDKFAALERLARLKADGIITDAEFAAEKAAVLAGRATAPTPMPPQVYAPPSPPSAPPTIIYAAPPQSSGWLKKGGSVIGFLVLCTLAIAMLAQKSGPTGTTPTGQIPACASADAKDMLTRAYEQSAASKVANIQVLDIANMTERGYDPAKFLRTCSADLTLNTGAEHTTYVMRFNSDRSGFLLQTQADEGSL